MQRPRRDQKPRVGHLGLPLRHPRTALATKDHLIQIALEQRRRLREVLHRIAPQHLLSQLAISRVRILCQRLHQRPGEHALRLPPRLAPGQVLLRRDLVGLGREEGDEGPFARAAVERGFGGPGVHRPADLHRIHIDSQRLGRQLPNTDVVLGTCHGPGRCPRMAAVEHRPDIRTLGAQPVDQRADLVIDQRVFHRADLVRPRPNVHRQEQLVQPVQFRCGVQRRCLGSVPREMQVDEVPRLHLRRQVGKGPADRPQRRWRRAGHAIRQHRNVFGCKGDRGLGGQILRHQLHIIGRALQPPPLLQVRILVGADQQRMVLAGHGGKGGQKQGCGEKGFHQFVIKAYSAPTGPLLSTFSVNVPALAGVQPQ